MDKNPKDESEMYVFVQDEINNWVMEELIKKEKEKNQNG